jgi:MarC family membrane protein
MELTFVSATLLLIFVFDPFGNIPLFVSVLNRVEPARRTRVVLRECLIAFLVLLVFLFFGRPFLALLHISETSLGIAGGVILFLIALRIIFHSQQGIFGDIPGGEPFIVPLAIPAIAGPSSLATLLLLTSRAPERIVEWILALIVAIVISTLVLAFGRHITDWLGQRGVMALERLMGLLLTAISIEMLLTGIEEFVRHLRQLS